METTGSPDRIMEIQDQKIELQGATLLHLNEIRKWTNFLSILGFIAIGLVLVFGIIMIIASSFGSAIMAYNPYGFLGLWIGIAYIIIALIYFFPILYLFRFSRYVRQSLMQINTGGNSNVLMARAIEYMKRHFRFVGIFMIVILSMYVLVIIGVIFVFVLK